MFSFSRPPPQEDCQGRQDCQPRAIGGVLVAGVGYRGFDLRVNGVSVGNRVYGFVFALGMYIMSTAAARF